jgi:hypothetical protein
VQHAKGPHLGEDQDPGDPFTELVGAGEFAAMTGAPFTTLFDANCPTCSPQHEPHYDVYTLKYQRLVAGAGQPVNFLFTGHHVIPEPASLMLFGIGALGLVGSSRGRRKASLQRHLE